MGLARELHSRRKTGYHGRGQSGAGADLREMTISLDNMFTLRDEGDPTREAQFQCSGISPDTRRTYAFQDFDMSFAGLSGIDVRHYGATGDGTTDDSTAVRNAITAAPAGSVVYFPSGTYNLATWTVLTVSKRLWLRGDGAGNTILTGTSGNHFISYTENLRVSDMSLTTWSTVFDCSAVTGVLTQVVFENLRITSFNRAIYGNGSTASTGVRGMLVRNCHIETGTSYGIFINVPIMERIHILHNVVKDVVQRSIDLGGNSLVFADDRGLYVIDGNICDGCTAVGASAISIIVYGHRATITNNLVKSVSRDDEQASDCDGIYTKCRFAVIANNVLIDAGQAEGFINIKGGARNETVVQPYGFSVIVANNMLVDTQASPTLAEDDSQTNGIKIATSEVLVTGNHLEGLTETGIYTDSDSGSDAPNSNIVISNNTIKNHRGKRAIAIFGKGNRLRVLDNLIDTVDATFDPSQNVGIAMLKKEGGDVDIRGNRIYNIVDGGNTPVGIMINPSNSDVGVDTVVNLRVDDNHVDTATHGIQFTWDAAEISLDDVLVRHNTFSNCSNTITYTDTPTNLTEILIAPVIVREAADDVAIYNSTGANPQELRIYNERVDASNYERLSLQCNATAARISTQFLGTLAGGAAAALPLEIDISGTQVWKWSASGHYQPVTSATYDIGSTSLRTRDVYVGGDLLLNNAASRLYLDYTNSATIGAVTINKVSGQCNVAAAAASVVVTNNRVTAASHVMAVAAALDANKTAVIAVVPAAGSFTVHVDPVPAANMAINFVCLNAD